MKTCILVTPNVFLIKSIRPYPYLLLNVQQISSSCDFHQVKQTDVSKEEILNFPHYIDFDCT